MILIDQIGHMIATESEEELHLFAGKLGLKREWFQDKTKYLHYDLTTQRKRDQAIKLGAKQVSPKEILNKAWWSNDQIIL